MSSYYAMYQAYIKQLYSGISGLAILGIFLVLAYYVLASIIVDEKWRTWTGRIYITSCAAFYVFLVVTFL